MSFVALKCAHGILSFVSISIVVSFVSTSIVMFAEQLSVPGVVAFLLLLVFVPMSFVLVVCGVCLEQGGIWRKSSLQVTNNEVH